MSRAASPSRCRAIAWLLTLALTAAGASLPLLARPARQQPPAKDKEAKNGQPMQAALPDSWLKPLVWRSIGPANMSGRVTALAVVESDPSTYYAATASGGLLKTTNNGTTFQHLFDKQTTVSIGDVCVAPSNRDVVWVGTGEANPRNSVSYGDGVYKSTDGGKTWQHMGLKDSFQVGKILIHPTNPDVVWVGALGRLYGPNEQRGVFKTTDGGKTWHESLDLGDRTGVIDMAMHPTDPDTLLAAAWERRRDGHDSFLGPERPADADTYDPIVKWGEKAGIYRTTDGGKTWSKVTRGLPTSKIGRVGLDWYRKDPKVVFAVVDCEKIGMGTPPKKVAAGTSYLGITGEDADGGAKLVTVAPDGPAAKAGLKVGDVIASSGKTKVNNYEDLIEIIRASQPGDKLKMRVLHDDKARDVEVTVGARPQVPGKTGFGGPGGPKKGRPYHAYYGGQRENVQGQQGENGYEYGGVYRSDDGGESWTRVNSLNPRPMYFSVVRVDPSDDKHVYILGVAQHRSTDGGKTFRADAGRGVHADGHALWINPRDGRHMVIGTDGGTYVSYDRAKTWDHLNHMALGQFYHVAVCNKRPYWVYGGLQDNGTWGGPSVGLRGGGPINEDWVSVGGGDGFVCRVDPTDPDLVYFEIQNGVTQRRNLRTGASARIAPKRDKGDPPHRFNWNTPFILSHHNPRIYYVAAEVVFRSVKQGDDLKVISPEITRTKKGSATALAESPRNADVLWAGTDDGALWVTRDGGQKWVEVSGKVGLPGPRWVATIEASRFAEGRAYVAFDAHRSDDDRPYLYMTDDYGQTWRSITANLPAFGSTRCLREDVSNKDLLYCGTEFAVFASLDRGTSWTKINNNLPTVAIHEIAVHPTAGEIVAATHGRSLWVLDVSALRQATPEVLGKKAHLMKPETAVRWHSEPRRGGTNRRFAGQNPPFGAQFYYSLGEPAEKVGLRVLDVDGEVLARLQGPAKAGLHRVSWDMVRQPAGGKGGPPVKGKGKVPTLPGQPGVRPVPEGFYRVVLSVDGAEQAQTFRVEGDPSAGPVRLAEEEEEDHEGEVIHD